MIEVPGFLMAEGVLLGVFVVLDQTIFYFNSSKTPSNHRYTLSCVVAAFILLFYIGSIIFRLVADSFMNTDSTKCISCPSTMIVVYHVSAVNFLALVFVVPKIMSPNTQSYVSEPLVAEMSGV